MNTFTLIVCIYSLFVLVVMPIHSDILPFLKLAFRGNTMNNSIITLADATNNAQLFADALDTNRDNLIVDLWAQSQTIADEIQSLEYLASDEYGEHMVAPLPVQYVIINLRAALDTLEDVLATELSRRAPTEEITLEPVDEQPLDFNRDNMPVDDCGGIFSLNTDQQ